MIFKFSYYEHYLHNKKKLMALLTACGFKQNHISFSTLIYLIGNSVNGIV